MKLYTEEEIKRVFELFQHSGSDIPLYLQELTPIELPSDEEIDTMFYKVEKSVTLYDLGYMDGAKWMKETILNQNK